MEPLTTEGLAFLYLAAAFAGAIDAIVGGGGLIQIPALFSAVPSADPASLFGTNKFASIFGTVSAAMRYAQRVHIPWRATLPAACAAFAASYGGALTVAYVPREIVRPAVLILLIAAAAYTFARKEFGSVHRPPSFGRGHLFAAIAIGGVIGYYDGLFGPGTGSFLIFLFIRVFGFDFLHASAAAKVVNAATNFAALSFFLPGGHWLPLAATGMALCNVGGSWLGSHLAIRYGSGWVRRVFLVVVGVLIVRFAWETVAEVR